MDGKATATPKGIVDKPWQFKKGNKLGGRHPGVPNRETQFREDVFKLVAKHVIGQPTVVKEALQKDPIRAMEMCIKLMPKSDVENMSAALDVIRKIQALQNEGGRVDPKTITFLMQCQERAGEGKPVTPDVVTEQLSADMVGTNGKKSKRSRMRAE